MPFIGIAPFTIPKPFLAIGFFFIPAGGIAGIGLAIGIGVFFCASAENWLIAFADGFLAIRLPSLLCLLH